MNENKVTEAKRHRVLRMFSETANSKSEIARLAHVARSTVDQVIGSAAKDHYRMVLKPNRLDELIDPS